MNWDRINELTLLINKLVSKRSELRKRREGLADLLSNAGKVQPKIEAAVISASSRLNALEAFGMSGALLDDIIAPVRSAPNCSGLSASVRKGVSDTEDELADTQKKINNASWEKSQLEKEMAQL